MTIRVLLADDQPLIRTGFKLILGSEPGITVVGEAGDGAEAVGLARSHRPDIVLMDIYVSPLTAKTHVNRAMTKLGIRDRAQPVVLAYQRGIVRPGDTLT